MLNDLLKYKRVFAFGCSYVRHIYPGFADVLAKECINASFYNMGKPGSGNSLILYRLAEAHNRYKFNKDDLIVVMWTSFPREDRWFEHKWQTWGNVFNNNYYDEEFIKKYADPNGYLISSAANIFLGNNFLDNIESDSLVLTAMPFAENEFKEIYDKKYLEDVILTYGHMWSKMPTPYFKQLHPEYPLGSSTWYKKGASYMLGSEMKNDAHPNALSGYQYLKDIGLPMTDISYKYALEQVEILKNCKTQEDIFLAYQPYWDEQADKIKDMFY